MMSRKNIPLVILFVLMLALAEVAGFRQINHVDYTTMNADQIASALVRPLPDRAAAVDRALLGLGTQAQVVEARLMFFDEVPREVLSGERHFDPGDPEPLYGPKTPVWVVLVDTTPEEATRVLSPILAGATDEVKSAQRGVMYILDIRNADALMLGTYTVKSREALLQAIRGAPDRSANAVGLLNAAVPRPAPPVPVVATPTPMP